jgi:hypothetical protein
LNYLTSYSANKSHILGDETPPRCTAPFV